MMNCNILIVEDLIDTQRLLAFILSKAVRHIDLAENGKVAVERVRKAALAYQPYDLIIMDLQMPVMDGDEAIRILRREGIELPILVLTANNTPYDRQNAVEAGCDEFMPKPFAPKHLLEMIQQLLVFNRVPRPMLRDVSRERG
jgi:CheY-like chemotaxis protein